MGVLQADIQSLGVVVILFLGVVVILFPSSSSFSLAIRVKERECVRVVFEGDKLIQVTTSLSSFHLLVFSNCFYFLVVV